MYKAALLMAASVIALHAGAALASGLFTPTHPLRFNPFQLPKGAKVLWNQNSNSNGQYINSQNYTTGYTSFSNQAADDFVIPTGKTWTVTEIDVTGEYSKGGGSPISEDVIFYKNKHGMPGAAVMKGTFNNLDGGAGPNFAFRLPGKGLKLKAGTYWVSVIADVNIIVSGQWYWNVNGTQHGNQATWQNPDGGFTYCQTWGTIEDCIGYGPDLMFELKGTSK